MSTQTLAPRGANVLHSRSRAELDGRPDAGADDATRGFRHDALIYDSLEELTGVAVPFLLEGLAAGDGAVIAVGPEATDALRTAVGPARGPADQLRSTHEVPKGRVGLLQVRLTTVGTDHAATAA
ncbi:MEDS domain-containing protein [Geodermatophilus sp. DSM 44513]|uniref:MEDS domain-containing protein n=1 Tax=Geodermatophilus sp. DSM 44513 TaxID=1528104 RepID=UPI0028F74421|nr:MEDS domain-containing protein [Geodermatophilus sp. DSM 44513]WNV76844.1 MEDS domain-containing protein [Geodermatophilus sp. DSM 44513]